MVKKYLQSLILFLIFVLVFLSLITLSVFSQRLPLINKQNKTLMQTFYWELAKDKYAVQYPEENNLWNLLSKKALKLADLGITGVWLPPANKAAGGINDEGYAAYDLWDLGEFKQKDSIRTKYGSKKELLKAVDSLHKNGIKVYYDAVLNHRMGGDSQEVVSLASGERTNFWTRFEMAGREKYFDKANDWNWGWQAFDSADGRLLKGKNWDDTADDDYLMGNDVDYQNLKVEEELIEWGKWIVNDIGFDGFRLDAVKHIDRLFVNNWINAVQGETDKDLIFMGEAWYENSMGLYFYLLGMNNEDLTVFDFSLRKQFSLMRDGNLNMSSLTKAGLVNKSGLGERVITFVDNHDTGRDEVEYTTPIFQRKYQAYTYIMTREMGIPMLYWKDYYISGLKEGLDKIVKARKYFAYGPGYEVNNNDSNVYSYVRAGLKDVPGTGLVMMIAGGDTKSIISKEINSCQANQQFYDFTGNVKGIVETNAKGIGQFKVINSEKKGWSIWVPQG
ncbi:alpha-amylase family glycosyl hydrolase [Halocella sp. SP3-1]|uniref:alpha-amylase family glycosyl hydrolase n=1 Tax=Halocella sp. SP3-1 TaxID=2382161 RepID=UPI000F74EB53|nr:alpha-amylase family glycosyl hydrolase [Halocella sp. SP3-1]AZO93170.1 DUF1939 domain-containing protein [Halocella sp. SP3-1]